MPYFVFDKIELGSITFYTWGLFLGLAFLIGYCLVLRQAQKKGISQAKIFWLTLFILLGSLAGARLAYLGQFPLYYLSFPEEFFNFRAGGLMFYGGLFGGLITGWLYLKRAKINFWPIADILAPALALGIFITRMGCSLINDHQGAITTLPWAIEWSDGILRHPVAVYLALNGLILFFILWFLKSRLTKPGQLSIIFLIWYSISRFFLDFTRVNDPQYLSLFISQWISLIILIGVIISLFVLQDRSKRWPY